MSSKSKLLRFEDLQSTVEQSCDTKFSACWTFAFERPLTRSPSGLDVFSFWLAGAALPYGIKEHIAPRKADGLWMTGGAAEQAPSGKPVGHGG